MSAFVFLQGCFLFGNFVTETNKKLTKPNLHHYDESRCREAGLCGVTVYLDGGRIKINKNGNNNYNTIQ